MPTAGGILGGPSRITMGGNVGGGGGRCPVHFLSWVIQAAQEFSGLFR